MLKRTYYISEVIANYSKIAWFYNFWSLLTETKVAKKVIELATIKDGETILEVAVGTGKVFSNIIEINKSGRNEGIDISPDMLNRAIKLLNKTKCTNYQLQLASAYKLPFKSNSFDLIINNFMFDLLPEEDFNGILCEFYRLLKTPGRIIISTMSFGHKWYHKIWYWIAKYFPSILTGCRPVTLQKYIEKAKFIKIEKLSLSQNTLPSDIIRGYKS